jgi:hypothetical protein
MQQHNITTQYSMEDVKSAAIPNFGVEQVLQIDTSTAEMLLNQAHMMPGTTGVKPCHLAAQLHCHVPVECFMHIGGICCT